MKSVRFEFSSDSEIEDHGFQIKFFPNEKKSNFEHLTEASGQFQTKDFDTGLQDNAIFYWLIEVEPGNRT